jgi:SAM-dependent methyltransferase
MLLNDNQVYLNEISNKAWFAAYLACPDCKANLQFVEKALVCNICGFKDDTGRDLRPQKPHFYSLGLSNHLSINLTNTFDSVDTSRPVVTYQGPSAIRDSRELMSELSANVPSGGAVLDLGCGPRDQFIPINYLGYHYVGIDYSNSAADFLADAHAIPFKPASFDCVFSYAVLEHLHNPFIAIREIERVLKPDGFFIGTASQGEPFHDSFFHYTPWGLLSVVTSVPNLKLLRLWDSGDTLGALARMGRYARIIKRLLGWLNTLNCKAPWLAPRKMRWPQKQKEMDKLYRAGSLCFVIRKTGKAE